ncbi:putative thioesterase PNKD [Babylonia areolata]|uniref:putative thioesterase PNKD n=1 Tax=Babylonia areolata TaxID=304850 RepID=UPI003FD3090D
MATTFATVNPIFIKQKDIPELENNRRTVLEICVVAERTAGQGFILGGQQTDQRSVENLPNHRRGTEDILVKRLRLRERPSRYFFYSRTRLGYYYHLRNIAKAKKRLKRRGGWHTLITPFHYGDLMIVPIPIMMDNYAYLVLDRRSNSSVVVDPGHAEPVQAYLSTMGVKPEAVLITHKHWDHSGGNREMRQHYPEIKVYGSSSDNVPDITHPVKDGDTLGYGDLKIRAVLTPGHTTGHVVYILDGAPFGTSDSVFTGDMLFLCGCEFTSDQGSRPRFVMLLCPWERHFTPVFPHSTQV